MCHAAFHGIDATHSSWLSLQRWRSPVCGLPNHVGLHLLMTARIAIR